MIDDFGELFGYRWGWDVFHLGRGRWLWFSAGIDLRNKQIHACLFGLAISWGRQINESRFEGISTATKPLSEEEWRRNWNGGVDFSDEQMDDLVERIKRT